MTHYKEVEKLKKLESSKNGHHKEVETRKDKKLAEYETEKENNSKKKNIIPGYVKWVLAGSAVGVAFYFWWKRSQ